MDRCRYDIFLDLLTAAASNRNSINKVLIKTSADISYLYTLNELGFIKIETLSRGKMPVRIIKITEDGILLKSKLEELKEILDKNKSRCEDA